MIEWLSEKYQERGSNRLLSWAPTVVLRAPVHAPNWEDKVSI